MYLYFIKIDIYLHAYNCSYASLITESVAHTEYVHHLPLAASGRQLLPITTPINTNEERVPNVVLTTAFDIKANDTKQDMRRT